MFDLHLFRGTEQKTVTAVVVLTLAFGIVLNTAAFSVCNALWFRPLPFQDPERLVMVLESNARGGYARLASQAGLEAWRGHSRSFETLAAISDRGFNLGGGGVNDGEPQRVRGAVVSPEFIETLGYRPVRGRLFLPSDFEPGAQPVALVGERFWRSSLAGRPDITGSQVVLDGEKATIIGVLPIDFRFLYASYHLVLPLKPASTAAGREEHNLQVVARLKPGVAVGAARAEMDTLAKALEREQPESRAGWTTRVSPLKNEWMREARRMYPVLLAAAALILLIVCGNVSNVLLARAAAREKEMAVRMALGAGRSRLIRQLLGEGMKLSLAAGLLAVLAVSWLRSALVAAYPEMAALAVDWRVMTFALAVSVLTGLLFGAGPAVTASGTGVSETLKQEGGGVLRRSGRRLRWALVVSEMAVAMVMLTGTGLLLKTILNLQWVDTGYRSPRLLTARVSMPASACPKPEDRAAFVARSAEAVAALPGIEGVAFAGSAPLSAGIGRLKIAVEGRPAPPDSDSIAASFTSVGPGYFRTVGVPLHAGREFTVFDRAGAPAVAIVNARMAELLWPGARDIAERRIRTGPQEPWLTVVGVAADVRQDLVRPPFPEVFVPYLQRLPETVVFAARTSVKPGSLAGPVRGALARVDPRLPVSDLKSLEDLKADYLPAVFVGGLAGFSLIALALVAIGLYGLVSYLVVQGTREIGLRVALGAVPRQVLSLVLGQGIRAAGLGALIGLALSIGAGRLLAHLIPLIDAGDVAVFLSAPLLLLSLSAAATLIPARRAVRIEPAAALRGQ
ncbi:MAG: ABC transporter permease [Bryobacterales bacterium]|nr:ABC transporter permease [Bryobacterales bacterium]